MNQNFLRAAAAVATIVAAVVAVLTFVREIQAPTRTPPDGTVPHPASAERSDAPLPSPRSEPPQCVPSFDCNVDRRFADQLVCRTPSLCERDRRMGALYSQVRAHVDAERWTKIRQAQRDWWAYRRNECRDVDCLTRAYDERIRTLELELGQ